jgi:predicted nucleic acid-binding protein
MLDTNVLIALEQPGGEADRRVRAWLAEGERMGVCTLVWTEYLCGPLPPAKIAAADALFRWKEPFAVADTQLAAFLFNAAGRRRGTILDAMIAAVAIRCQAEFFTFNRSDFSPFVAYGLKLAV